MKTVCVYCGSNTGVNTAYFDAAHEMGRQLAERGLTLVYGGAHVGLMGTLADAALAAGGKVVGIMPSVLIEKEVAHRGLSELVEVASMHARKAQMELMSDAFIAMPGGYGTLDEMFEMLTWSQLGLHEKPCALLNIAGYFDALIKFIAHASEQGFVQEQHKDMLISDTSVASLLDRIERYVPQPTSKWTERK